MKILLTTVLVIVLAVLAVCLACCMILSGRLSEMEDAAYAASRSNLQINGKD